MRLDLTKAECQWISDLVRKDKEENENHNIKTPHPLFELRRDNMESLEYKIESAIKRQLNREVQVR